MALAVLVVGLQGCVSLHPVPRQSGEASWRLAEINERASTRRARVVLADGRRLTVEGLRAEPDSTSWIADGRYEAVPTSGVSRIEFVRRGRGALEGLGIGLASGIVVGGLGGFTGYDGPDFLASSRAGSALVGAVFLGALTTPIGLALGVAEGHREVYEFRGAPAD